VAERPAASADPSAAEYAHVGDPEWLRAHDLFVAEGRLLVQRLLTSDRFTARSILLTPTAAGALGAALDGARCPVFVAPQSELRLLTGFDFHRGCLALAHRPAAEPPLESFAGCPLLLGIEGVGNPDNIGGLFRVAAAFGAEGVLLDPSSGDPLYRKAIRTSMGAALRVPFLRVAPWPGRLNELRARGFRVIALTPDSAARPLAELAASRAPDVAVIILVGSEGAGLSTDALGMADEKARIPIRATIDSLNVVVAAGIALSALAERGSAGPS
jgi:tRNA G18 (ribose-2'-O)-methylase SpoU